MDEQLLKTIAELCEEKGEAEDVQITLRAGLPLAEVRSAIEELEEAGLIEVEEFGFSCFAEYTVRGLTEKGYVLLDK